MARRREKYEVDRGDDGDDVGRRRGNVPVGHHLQDQPSIRGDVAREAATKSGQP